MARAKAQREAAQPRNIDTVSSGQAKEIEEIEARRQAANLTADTEPAKASPASEKTE